MTDERSDRPTIASNESAASTVGSGVSNRQYDTRNRLESKKTLKLKSYGQIKFLKLPCEKDIFRVCCPKNLERHDTRNRLEFQKTLKLKSYGRIKFSKLPCEKNLFRFRVRFYCSKNMGAQKPQMLISIKK